MSALIVSYYVVAYLLVPSGLFKSFSSLFVQLKKFQRTKTEEITFAVFSCVLPFVLASIFVWSGCLEHPFYVDGSNASRRVDYKTVYSGLMNDKFYYDHQQLFWSSTTKVMRRQARFLFWYYLLVLGEGFGFAFLVRNYGKWKNRSGYSFLADRILLPSVSEWYFLLTTFNFPPIPRRVVWADVLTAEDRLYKGTIGDYFLDSDGALSGFILEQPNRFDREAYIKSREVDPTNTRSNDFWIKIPSGAFYIPKDKILNVNLTYVPDTDDAEAATATLRAEGLDVEIQSVVEPYPAENIGDLNNPTT